MVLNSFDWNRPFLKRIALWTVDDSVVVGSMAALAMRRMRTLSVVAQVRASKMTFEVPGWR